MTQDQGAAASLLAEFLRNFLLNQGVFPETPLREMMENFESNRHLLLTVLDETVQGHEEIHRNWVGHYYAIYLLAKNRETEAYPLLCNLLTLPDEYPFVLLGEVCFSHMPAILASVYDGDYAPLCELIEDPEVCLPTKIACITALGNLFLCNKITRRDLVELFSQVFDTLEAHDEVIACMTLMNTIKDLQFTELIAYIRSSLQQGHTRTITLDEFEECLTLPTSKQTTPLLVDDPIGMLQQLECFSYLDVVDGFTPAEKAVWGQDITKLAHINKHTPREALERLISKPDDAKPLLHRIMEYTKARYYDIEQDEVTHIYALYLLAQFRDTSAYQLVVELLRLSDDEDEESHLTDVWMNNGHRILASLFDGDLKPLTFLLDFSFVSTLARHTALRTLALLCHLGTLPREEFVELMHRQIENLEDEENPYLLALFAMEMLSMDIHELYDRIGASYQKHAIDEEILPIEQFEYSVAHGISIPQSLTLISNIFDELSQYPLKSHKQLGRNDLCPCQSGKKYKKCCMK